MRYLALVGVLLLSGCVTDGQGYVRASGRTNPERLQLALAECQGEAAATPQASISKALEWWALPGP
jgi:Tfp pilus assembly protein PilF